MITVVIDTQPEAAEFMALTKSLGTRRKVTINTTGGQFAFIEISPTPPSGEPTK
jgi:hypothetical protein